MRLLSVVPLYPPHHLGGYEVACKAVTERFAERGHESVVLTGEHRMAGVEDGGSVAGVDVRRTLKGWWDWEKSEGTIPPLAQRVRTERHNQRALRRALEDFRPDVASIWNLCYMSWTLPTVLERENVPLVLTFLDDWVTYAHTFDAWTRIFDRRPWARTLGAVLGLETRLPTFTGAEATVASEFIAQQIERNGRWKFPEAPLIRLGIETRDFPVIEAVPKAWSWRLLYSGRVVPQKGVSTLVRSLVHMPEATLVVDGPASNQEKNALVALAADLGVGDRVSFTRSPRSELAHRYRGADAVVFPSEWAEPYGLVPLEAMACGVPVVATGTGGSGELLHDGVNCLRFQAGDAVALAGAVTRLAEDPELRSRVTAGGTQTALDLNIDAYTDRLERVHQVAAGVSTAG